MSSMQDDRAAYREAMARAEAASGIERDAEGNETNGIEAIIRGEIPAATPELEGAVPVTASDQPLTPEAPTPVVEATPVEQQPEAPAAPPSLEELQAKLAVAEARLEEKDSFIGRQSSEVGELRQAVEEMRTQLARPQVPQGVGAVTPVTQELIDTDPALAVQAAFEQAKAAAAANGGAPVPGSEHTLQRAFEAWKDPITGDPFAAANWLNERRLEQQQAAFDEKIAATQRQLETVTAPLAAVAAKDEEAASWKAAFDEVKATRPDFIANAARLLEEVAPQYPSFLPALQSGDARAKADALAALYALDKHGNPDAVQQQLAKDAQEAAAEAAAALAAAGAVTGQSTVGQGSELATEEELEQQRYVRRMDDKPSLSRGWTGRS